MKKILLYYNFRYHLWMFGNFLNSVCGFVIAGQSYEIRMLDNRKIGELPEITGKMVKVRWHASSHTHTVYLHVQISSINICLEIFVTMNFRASSVWCFMTDDFSTQSTSSWKDGAGTGLGIASLTWVSTEWKRTGVPWWLQNVLVLMYCMRFVCERMFLHTCMYINHTINCG